MNNRFNKFLIFVLFIILSFFLPIFYSTKGVTDPFSFWHTAYIQKFINTSHFPLEDSLYSPKYIPGAMSMLIIFAKVTGIEPKSLQFIPIVGLMLPITYYSLCKKFTAKEIYIFIVTLMMLNIPSPMEFLTTWPHAFGYYLYLVFLLAYCDIFKTRTVEKLIIIMLVFLGIHFYSYTAESWALSFLIVINIVLLVLSFLNKNYRTKVRINLLVLFLVVFLGFNKIFYEAYLPQGRYINTMIESHRLFFYNYGKLFSLPETDKYIYRAEPNLILSLLGFIYVSSLITIILLVGFIVFRNIIKNKRFVETVKNLSEFSFFKIAIVTVGVIDIIIYAAAGVVNLRYIYFLFPLLVLISLNQLNIKNLFKLNILLILLFVITSHTFLSWQSDKFIFNNSKYRDMEPSAYWFFENTLEKKAIIDLRTGNKYLLESLFKNTNFERSFINADGYQLLVEGTHSNSNLRNIAPYVVINKRLNRIQTLKWGNFEPIYKYSTQINENVNLRRIYEDDFIWIFKTC